MKTKQKSFNANSELRSKNSREMWTRPGFREKHAASRSQTILEQRAQFPHKNCENCGNDFVCFPSRINTQRFCSKDCRVEASRNKPNIKNRGKIPSARSGGGISGVYDGWKFRSTFELSFIINYLEPKKLHVQYEPFVIPLMNGKHYVPDFVCIEERVIFEIKHAKSLLFPTISSKLELVRQWCNENNYSFEIFTEDRMRIISYNEIANLVIAGRMKLNLRKNMGVRFKTLLETIEKRLKE